MVRFVQCLTPGNLLKLGVRAVEHVRVTTILVVIIVLPDGVEAPAGRELANLAAVARDDQWALVGKHGRVARARLPPAGRGVEERVAARLGVIRLDKVADPAPHGRLAEAVAGVAVGAVLEVHHTYLEQNEIRGCLRVGLIPQRLPGKVTPSLLQPPP